MNLDALKALHTGKDKSDETLTKIEAFLKAKHNPVLNYTPKPSHVPSSFGSACFRKIYYSYWKVPKDTKTDLKSARIFETGNYYEAMVMSWLKAVGEHIPYRGKDGEIPKNWETGLPDPQFPIALEAWRIRKGFIDNVAVSGGELWLYEIKSKASFKFEEMLGPDEDHKIQTGIYFRAFNDHLARGDFSHIPELGGHAAAAGVKIIYVNKDNSDVKLFKRYPEALNRTAQLIDAKVKKANEYIDVKELPPKTPDKCSYCPFNKKCKKDENPLLAV
jgi:hypothetical protein